MEEILINIFFSTASSINLTYSMMFSPRQFPGRQNSRKSRRLIRLLCSAIVKFNDQTSGPCFTSLTVRHVGIFINSANQALRAEVTVPNYVQHQSYLYTRRTQPPAPHPLKFIPLQASCDAYNFSFWPRTINDWNNLLSY